MSPSEAWPDLTQPYPQFTACVLLVEGSHAADTRRMLEQLGFRTVVATDCAQALQTLADASCDLILLDWRLPGADAAPAELRPRDGTACANPAVPIIALIADECEGDLEACRAAGVDDVLPRPFDRDALAAKLGHWLTARAVDGKSDGERYPSVDPAIESKALDAIRELAGQGTPDFLDQIIRVYLESTPELLSTLRCGLAQGHAEVVRTAAHTLKSSSGIVGATRLADLCKRLETAARSGAFTLDPTSMEQLDAEYARVRTALERALETTR
ncbi:MAG TPA: Hpt domain-containing protein [Burkholderiales bacterium]|nr:Hpt domain-containing protein [Burkholderiales bacterium]